MDLFVRPNGTQVVRFFDDFLNANSPVTGSIHSDQWWNETQMSIGEESGGDNPGTLSNNSAALVDLRTRRRYASISNGTYTTAWLSKIETLSNGTNRYECRLGMLGINGAPGSAVPSDAIYFSYR